MGSYGIMSAAHKLYLQRHPSVAPEQRAEIEKYIKVCDILNHCDREERLKIFDTGAFNNAVKGYIVMASDQLKLTDKQKNELLDTIQLLLYSRTAKDAEQYYYDH